MLEREIHTLFNVRDDDQCAHRWRQIVMGISLEAHILREVFGFHQFADVMKIRTDAAEGRIRADGFRRSIGDAPPTIIAVTIPLPTARALCTPTMPQSLAVG